MNAAGQSVGKHLHDEVTWKDTFVHTRESGRIVVVGLIAENGLFNARLLQYTFERTLENVPTYATILVAIRALVISRH